MGKAARFVTSLRMRLTPRRPEVRVQKEPRRPRSGMNCWFSTSDLDRLDDNTDDVLDDSGLDVTSPSSGNSFMTSFMNRFRSPRNKKSQGTPSKRPGVTSWFSTSDLDKIGESTFLLEKTENDVTSGKKKSQKRNRDSGYIGRLSGHEETRPRSWILEDKVCLDLERGEVTPCTVLQQDANIRKSESVSSLLRATSIQDRSLKVTRKRRQNVAKRNRRDKYASFKKAIFPDEGVEVTSDDATTDDSCDEPLSPSCEKRVTPEEFKDDFERYSEIVSRHNSVQKKSWEIRRRRKQELQKKRRSANLNCRPITWIE